MKRGDVLAIGIDAAEPALVRRLIEQGRLPALRGLLEAGEWRRVGSPARIGSGAVWPTFCTGTDPAEHGMHSHWRWNPDTMDLTFVDDRRFTPFWEDLARDGATVGILDVPFAPFAGLRGGFEVSEWGAHDSVRGRTKVSPAALAAVVGKGVRPHPFSSGHPGVVGTGNRRELEELGSACLAGSRLRGDLAQRLVSEVRPELAIVVFPEVHRAGHYLWHAVAPEHPLYESDAFRGARAVSPDPIDVYREVDRQISRLVETVGPDATVFVFSLHGMRPGLGVPTILDPFLRHLGLAHLAGWNTRSWAKRASSTLAWVKRRAPRGLKKLYHKTVARSVRNRVAERTMLPAYDWSRTHAFSFPTDQHGWVRLNLQGREAKGIVSPRRYDETCDRIEAALRALTARDGRPLVRDVLRRGAGDALLNGLPDLVVHWDEAAHEPPVRLKNGDVYPNMVQLTGQHALDGFCIIKKGTSVKDLPGGAGDPVAAKDLYRLIVAALAKDRSGLDGVA